MNPTIEGLNTAMFQFIQDMIIYGLREAVIMLRECDFTDNPSPILDRAIAVYHRIAALYLSHEPELRASEHARVRELLWAAEMYGGFEQELASTAVDEDASEDCEDQDPFEVPEESDDDLLATEPNAGEAIETLATQGKGTALNHLHVLRGQLEELLGTALEDEEPQAALKAIGELRACLELEAQLAGLLTGRR